MSKLVIISIGLALLYSGIRPFFFRGKTGWTEYARGSSGQIPPSLAALSIFASLAGGFMVFGLVQMGFVGGASGYILGFAYIIGMPLLAYGIKKAPRIENENIFVIDGIAQEKFGNLTLASVLLLSCFLFAGILAAQFTAVAYYLRSFPGLDNYFVVLGIGAFLTLLYTVAFGFRGVLGNDYFQGACIVAVSIILPISTWLYGKASATPLHFKLFENGVGGDYGMIYPIAGFVFLLPSFLVRADLWQRVRLTAQGHRFRMLVFTGLLLAWFYISMTTVGILLRQNQGVYGFASKEVSSSLVPLSIINMVTDPFSQIVCLTGVLCALLSSIDSYLNLVSLCFVRLALWDLFHNSTMEKEVKERILVTNAKIATLGAFLLAAALAVLMPDIVELLSASFGGIGILVPVCLAGLFGRRKRKDYVGAVPIFLGTATLIISLPFLRELAFIPGVCVSLIVFLSLYFYPRSLSPVEDEEIGAENPSA